MLKQSLSVTHRAFALRPTTARSSRPRTWWSSTRRRPRQHAYGAIERVCPLISDQSFRRWELPRILFSLDAQVVTVEVQPDPRLLFAVRPNDGQPVNPAGLVQAKHESPIRRRRVTAPTPCEASLFAATRFQDHARADAFA